MSVDLLYLSCAIKCRCAYSFSWCGVRVQYQNADTICTHGECLDGRGVSILSALMRDVSCPDERCSDFECPDKRCSDFLSVLMREIFS